MKKETLKEVSDHLSELLDLLPVELKEPKDITRAHRDAFARLWADNSLRDALENLIRYQNKNLVAATTETQHIYFKARMDTLMQLLLWGKNNFVLFATLEKKTLTEEQKFHELEKQLSHEVQGEELIPGDQGIRIEGSESGPHAEAKPEASTKSKK